MLNSVTLVGRLTKDPEIKHKDNFTVGSFTLAVERNFKNKQGNRDADFIGIVVRNKLAELCENYVHKGDLISIRGMIQTRTWEDKDGKRNYVTEVVADELGFLNTKGGQTKPETTGFEVAYNNDDLPF